MNTAWQCSRDTRLGIILHLH